MLSDGGLLLGVIPDAEYVSGSCALDRGDMLLIYSDGITESQNKEGEEFGYVRLEKELRRSQTGSTDAALFSILGAVQDFAATRLLVDDMSLAILRRS
jgi:sigma-B regulation protein RsbU (phosphoserine phosphatase)